MMDDNFLEPLCCDVIRLFSRGENGKTTQRQLQRTRKTERKHRIDRMFILVVDGSSELNYLGDFQNHTE